MSHLTTIKVSIKREFIDSFLDSLVKANNLRGIQLRGVVKNSEIRDFYNNFKQVDRVLTTNSYSIGFTLNPENGCYEIETDSALTPIANQIKCEYAKFAVIETLVDQGYAIEGVNYENQEYKITASRWA